MNLTFGKGKSRVLNMPCELKKGELTTMVCEVSKEKESVTTLTTKNINSILSMLWKRKSLRTIFG